MKFEKKRDQEVKKNTTNYPKDGHKAFCDRCLNRYNGGICPITGTRSPSKSCQL